MWLKGTQIFIHVERNTIMRLKWWDYTKVDTSSKSLFSALPGVHKSGAEKLEYWPKFLGKHSQKSQTLQNFNFITSCVPEKLLSLPLAIKVLRFPKGFSLIPQRDLVRVDTPCDDGLSPSSVKS